MADTIQRGLGSTQELLSGTPALEGSEFHPRNTHPVGQGGNATFGTEDVETSPVTELNRPDYSDIRKADHEDEGELSGAVRDVKEAAKSVKNRMQHLADGVLDATGVIKSALTPNEPAEGWKAHGKSPLQERKEAALQSLADKGQTRKHNRVAPKPMVKDNTSVTLAKSGATDFNELARLGQNPIK